MDSDPDHGQTSCRGDSPRRLRGGTLAWVHRFEKLIWGVGLLLIAGYATAWVHRTVLSRSDTQRFHRAQAVFQAGVVSDAVPVNDGTALRPGHTDFELWSDSRIRHYQESLSENLAAPMALLRIPSIDLEVPVLEGVDELTLNRAIGRIEGTAQPGEAGNIGLAGHRDGFFRGLKDIRVGDTIQLETLSTTYRYVVDDLVIVDPENTTVLEPTPARTLTLVTCYPFYYIGSAPRRFIVRARLVENREERAHSS